MRRVRPSQPGRAADAARAGPVGCAGPRPRDGSVRPQRRLAGRAQGGGRVQGRGAVARCAAHRDRADEPGHHEYHAASRRAASRGRCACRRGRDRVRVHRPPWARDADPGGDRAVSRSPSLELLRRHAERVRAIVLADTKAEPDSVEGRRGRDELAALAGREGPDAVIDRLLPRLLAPATLATQPEVVAQVREMARRWTVPGLVGALHTLRDRPDSTATLRAVRVPTLIVVGEDDAVSPPAAAQTMAALIPGAQCHVIPAAGHLAPLEQPLATGRLLAEFLSGLP